MLRARETAVDTRVAERRDPADERWLRSPEGGFAAVL